MLLISDNRLAGRLADAGASPHVATDPEIARWYAAARFPGCRNPPVHLVTLALDAILELPADVRALGALPVIYSNCESCDAWMMERADGSSRMSFRLGADGRLAPRDPDAYRLCCREGSVVSPPKAPRAVVFTNDEHASPRPCLVLGGEPTWLQGAEGWGACDCARTPFFVGCVDASRLRCGDQALYLFVCPDCRTLDVLMQCA